MNDKKLMALALAGALAMAPKVGVPAWPTQRTYDKERFRRRRAIEAYKRQRAANRERRRLLALR